MPQWATFAGFAFIVTAGLLVLSHASRGAIDTVTDTSPIAGDSDQHTKELRLYSGPDSTLNQAPEELSEPIVTSTDARSDSQCNTDATQSLNNQDGVTADNIDSPDVMSSAQSSADATDHIMHSVESSIDDSGYTNDTREEHQTFNPTTKTHSELSQTQTQTQIDLSTTALLANVTISQGLFAMLLIVGAWIARIPVSAFSVGTGPTEVLILAFGIGTGVALYIGNEVGSALGARFGLGDGEGLRSALAPETSLEWAALLCIVLPIIAGFEELLFRGALIGVIASGYSISPWVLAVVSSLAFALGHGAQGRIGIIVTGVFGFVLASIFIVTDSLLIVIIAHYIVNALEFIIHEAFEIELYPVSDM